MFGRVLASMACLGTAALAVVWGCTEGSEASPPSTIPIQEAPCADNDAGGSSICPCDLDPTFTAIYTKVMATDSCGADRPNNCHSSTAQALGHNLFFAFDAGIDPAAAYAEFVGADGGGVKAQNINSAGSIAGTGAFPILRVAPGDPDASLLWHKLILGPDLGEAGDDDFGKHMPYNSPISVCPAVSNAVEQWIQAGAHFN